jgi:uncharacterized protein YjbI with pentapeptide repeats
VGDHRASDSAVRSRSKTSTLPLGPDVNGIPPTNGGHHAAMTDEQSPTTSRRPRWVWATAAAGAALFIAALIWGPWWIEGRHLRDSKGHLIPSAGIIVTGFRTMLIALAVGAVGAVGLYYTHKKHDLEQQQFGHAREQFEESQKQFETTLRETQKRDERQAELTREGQVTGRYVEAIKLIASGEISERLGGIYALERIMKDSDRDHRTIVEVLSAFIRTSLQEAEVARKKDKQREERLGTPGPTRKPVSRIVLSEDVKAALAVLSRRDPAQQQAVQVELSDAQLAHHNLSGVNWQGMNLERANLERANLRGANLDGAKLDGADLDRAILTRASLKGASLRDTALAGANLSYADLTGAHLDDARMTQAVMTKVNLTGAHLRDADLAHAGLNMATLDGANMTSANLTGARMGKISLRHAHLQRADLREAHLQNAHFEGANLEKARLEDARLQYAKLDKSLGLDTQTLAQARIYRSTTLPHGLAESPTVAARIQECEDRDAEDLEAAIRMAEEREDEYFLRGGVDPEVK